MTDERPRLLDLFCGAGGAAVGYHRAGFELVGVDIKPQRHYPFEFHQADALEYCTEHGSEFDAIHASPPCQAYTTMSYRWRGNGGKSDGHARLIGSVRDVMLASARPYVIENVVGAASEMRTTLLLRGGMFGLGVDRPRLFECSILIFAPTSMRTRNPIAVYGDAADGRWLNERKDGSRQFAAASLEEAQSAMQMDWADWEGTKEAIPPAYTEWIGRQLMRYLHV